MNFRHMIRHEWRLMQAERSVWVLSALAALLIAYGIWNGLAWVDFQKQTISAAEAEQEARLKSAQERLIALESSNADFDPNYFRDPRNPRAVNSVYGFQWAVLPPAPFASLAIGQSDLYPYYTAVTASSRHTSEQLDELQNPLQLLAGRFDLAFVAVYLLPLLVFAFSYNMLSEERENGTLSLVLAQPATLKSLLLAKSFLRVAYVALLSITISVAGFLAAGVHSGIQGAGVGCVYLDADRYGVRTRLVGTGHDDQFPRLEFVSQRHHACGYMAGAGGHRSIRSERGHLNDPSTALPHCPCGSGA